MLTSSLESPFFRGCVSHVYSSDHYIPFAHNMALPLGLLYGGNKLAADLQSDIRPA